MKQSKDNLTCWVITEGLAGTENQCLGVAEAMGVTPVIKRINLTQPWKLLSPYIGFEQKWSFTGDSLNPPWPDIVIAGGRKAIAAARYIRKTSKGKTLSVFIQDPRIPTRNFDLVAVPHHDPARGDNVIVTDGSPNRITPEKLEAAKKEFPEFEKVPGPRVAVLIGGSSKIYNMTSDVMENLLPLLLNLDAGLMVTTSRRTGEENAAILNKALKGTQSYIWDGEGPNPYFGMLGWADYILVTADSASMISEAASTGKPTYIIPLEGGSPRMDKFYQHLINKGAAQVFTGSLENRLYTPLKDSHKIAEEIEKLLKQHKK